MEEELQKVSAECERHYNSGQFEKAEADYTELLGKYKDVKNDKVLALIYNNRGHARYMQVEFYTAKDDYDEALQLDPQLAPAHYNRATILHRMGRYAEALPGFQKSVTIEPKNGEFQEGLNQCQLCIQ